MSLAEKVAPKRYEQVVEMLSHRKEKITRVYPLNKNSNFKPRETIRMRVNPDGHLNLRDSYLSFEIVGSFTGTPALNDRFRFTRNLESLVQRITVTASNGALIEQIDDYAVLFQALAAHVIPEDVSDSERQVLANGGDPALQTAEGYIIHSAAEAARTRVVNLTYKVGFLNSQFWPHQAGGFVVEIDLNTAGACMETLDNASGTATAQATVPADYTINNVEWVIPTLDYGSQFDQMINDQIASGGLNLRFDSYETFVDNSDSNRVVSKFHYASKYMKGIYTAMRVEGAIDANGDLLSGLTPNHAYQFVSDATTSANRYYYKVGNNYYPSFKAEVRKNAYPELMRSLARMGDVNGGSRVNSLTDLNGGTWTALTFAESYLGAINATHPIGNAVFGLNLEEIGEEALSGLDSNGNVELNFELDRENTTALVLHHFLHHDRIVTVRGLEDVEVSK